MAKPAALPPIAAQLFKPHFPLSKDGLVQNDEHFTVVFMHLLRSTSGQERLVYVYLTGKTDLRMVRIPGIKCRERVNLYRCFVW